MGKRGPKRRPIAERFWSRVRKGSPSECWLWQGKAKTAYGYGLLGKGGRSDRSGGNVAAHRVSWELHCGPIPAGLFVLHKCDIPACVNPNHLFLGTIRDNALDMFAKGRGNPNPSRGSKRQNSRLTESMVRDARGRRREGTSIAVLAESYGVSVATMSHALLGRTWSHVPDPVLTTWNGRRAGSSGAPDP